MNTPPATEGPREVLSLLTARVRDAYIRKPCTVDGALDVVSVCRRLAEHGQTHALVADGERLGIFTTTDLRDALLRPVPPQALAVRDVARFDLVEVQADAEVFEALWLMARRRVHRLIVRDGARLLGVLGQLDLVSFVAHHSHVVHLQIDEAGRIADLREAAARVDRMVGLLHASGIRIERIARLVGELNTRLVARAWELTAPAALQANSCLLVMGSEGRGEQIVKTDQDNALLLRDGFDAGDIEPVARRFGEVLADFGYPPCPGNVMVANPLWRQPVAAFVDTLRGWLAGVDADGAMNLAIFFDAVAVSGDGSLFERVRARLDELSAGHDAVLARFAAPADQFHEPGNWLTRLATPRDDHPLDLKKLGTFPIVHGVRALCLRHGVRERGTVERLRRLCALGHLDAVTTQELVDALHFLMALRLSHQLRQSAGGTQPGNVVRASELGVLEREPLHDALAIVNRFRALLRRRFHFDAL